MFNQSQPIDGESPTLWERVCAKIEVDPVTGCWNWTGAYSRKRNGMRPVIQVGGRGTRVVLVARLILTWYAGPPPSDTHEAGHTCPHGENSRCIRPMHLRWQTRLENEHQKRSYA